MFSKTAEFYDLVYSFKNYDAEAATIKELIRAEHSTARSILDIACGTGEHARFLAKDFAVDGIDLQPEFIESAQQKVGVGQFSVADMRSFELGRTYDVVQCLFSSIGYLTNPDDVVSALVCFKRHLNTGGIVVVEPWLTPDIFTPGMPHMAPPIDLPDLKLVRMNVSEREGALSRLRFHYLIAQRGRIEHVEEVHELALYSVEEMLSFFTRAGLVASHDPVGIFSGRGLYVARAAG